MKKNIHPEVNILEVKCLSCGQVHTIHSTAKEIRLDSCNNCHSAFTGKETGNLDRSCRIDKFNKRFNVKK